MNPDHHWQASWFGVPWGSDVEIQTFEFVELDSLVERQVAWNLQELAYVYWCLWTSWSGLSNVSLAAPFSPCNTNPYLIASWRRLLSRDTA